VSTADAVDREAEWLRSAGDGLPALLAPAGPWDVVQGYVPRSPAQLQCSIYVTRSRLRDPRVANQRKRPAHSFRLRLLWPIGSTSTDRVAEDEQRAFDNAIDLLVQRVRGTVGDHTHGGRFLSVAEAPETDPVTVDFDDPMASILAGALTARVTYPADDNEAVV